MPALPKTYRADLPAPQRVQFDRLVALLGKSPRTLQECYEAGQLIQAIQIAVSGYGKTWAKKLSAEVTAINNKTISLSLLYRLLKFAEVFTPEDVRRFDGIITWDSVMRLQAIDDAEDREAVIKEILSQKVTPSSRQVQALIRKRTPFRKPRGETERPGPSSHPNDALRALRAITGKWPGVYTAWTAGKTPALDRINRMRPDQVSPAFLSELEKTAEAVESMALGAFHLARDLRELARALHLRVKRRDL